MQVPSLHLIISFVDRRSETSKNNNRRAVVTLSQVLGGLDGLRDRGLGVKNLAVILHADPSDDLSGLRLLADRMNPILKHEQPSPTEKLLEPVIARDWMIKTNRMKNHEGILILTGTDHLSKAGFQISTSMHPRKLSEAYLEVSDSPIQILPQALSDITDSAIADYKESQAKQK